MSAMHPFNRSRSLALLALVAMAVTPGAVAAERHGSAGVAHEGMGVIHDWRADRDDGLYIELQLGEWYYARFTFPCTGIQFSHRVAIVVGPGNRLDRFSYVIVDNQRCYFRSLTHSAPPR